MTRIKESIGRNLAIVQGMIDSAARAAGRDPRSVRLIAVTKSQAPVVIPILTGLGILDLGENRVEACQERHGLLPPGGRLHHIGRLQSRQLSRLIGACDCIHGLCNLDHAVRLEGLLAPEQRTLPVFLQVSLAGEAVKAGVGAEELPRLLERVRRQAPHVEVVGLMTMAPALGGSVGEDDVRRCFAATRVLADRCSLARLSMGMSDDAALAIAEGATEVRIGRALFVGMEAA